MHSADVILSKITPIRAPPMRTQLSSLLLSKIRKCTIRMPFLWGSSEELSIQVKEIEFSLAGVSHAIWKTKCLTSAQPNEAVKFVLS